MATLKVLGSFGIAFTRVASTPLTLVAGTHGNVVYDNGSTNGTFTLPAANALGAGYSQILIISNQSLSATLTIQLAGSDVFYTKGVSSTSTLVLAAGQGVILTSDGGASSPARWYIN